MASAAAPGRGPPGHPVEQRDGVHDRQRIARQLGDAADIAGGDRSGFVLAMLRSLRVRSRVAISGCSMLYVPADPQQRCPSGGSTTRKPALRSSAFGSLVICWPCCRLHAE